MFLLLLVKSCLTLCKPMDCSPPVSSVHGISQQEYWNGLPFPSPGDFPYPGIEPVYPALAGEFFTTESYIYISHLKKSYIIDEVLQGRNEITQDKHLLHFLKHILNCPKTYHKKQRKMFRGRKS